MNPELVTLEKVHAGSSNHPQLEEEYNYVKSFPKNRYFVGMSSFRVITVYFFIPHIWLKYI